MGSFLLQNELFYDYDMVYNMEMWALGLIIAGQGQTTRSEREKAGNVGMC